MIGVQAIAGGIIGMAILLAILVLAVAGLIGGAFVYRSGRRLAGVACFVFSLAAAFGASKVLYEVFKPLPHRTLDIVLKSSPVNIWMKDDFRCIEVPGQNGPEDMCISQGYVNSLNMTLPDGLTLKINTNLIVAIIDRRENQLRRLEVSRFKELSKSEVETFLKTEIQALNGGAENSHEVARQQKKTIAWLNVSPESYSRREELICIVRRGYQICTRLKEPFSKGREYALSYEINFDRTKKSLNQ